MPLRTRKNLSVLILSAGFACLAACTQTGNKTPAGAMAAADSASCAKPADNVNPNGTSELASLMRDMFARSEEWKKAIENGQDLGIYPVAFDKLKTAKPTDEHMKNETFDPFADDFIRRTKELLSAAPEKRKEAFATYTEGCLNCHTTMCPGPVKRIKLLRIE